MWAKGKISSDRLNSSHCRFCAIQKNLEGLLDFTVILQKYTQMINYIKLELDLSHSDKLPKLVCFDCHKKFLETYNFFTTVNKSQNILMNLYESDNVHNCVNVSEIKTEIDDADIQEKSFDKDNTIQQSEGCTEEHGIKEYEIFLTPKEELNDNEEHYNKYNELNNLKEEYHNSNKQPVDSSNHVTVDSNIVSKEVTINNHNTLNSNEAKNTIKTIPLKRYIDKNVANNIGIRKFVLLNYIKDNNLEKFNEARENKDVSPNSSGIQNKNVNKNIPNNTVVIIKRIMKNVDIGNTGNDMAILSKIDSKQKKCTDGDNIKAINYKTIGTAVHDQVNNTDKETNQGTKNPDENAILEKGEADCLNENSSWADYPWSCDICKEKSGSIDEAREHSKHAHNYCYGFSCADCDKDFNTYNTFVEHVRTHRQHLRLYCQHCNQKFEDATECFEHSLEHWTGPQTICELCGEIFPNESRLASHRKSYRHKPQNRSSKRKPEMILRFSTSTWKDYVWSCLDCFKVLPDLQSLRMHIRAVHRRCFAMKCSDCLRVVFDFTAFVNHVRDHRPYLNNICHYCNEFAYDEDLKTHIERHFTNENPCYGCGEIFPNKELLQQHMVDYEAPVRHKFLKDKHYTCNVCYRIFKSIVALKRHNIIHDNSERPFICAVCGNGFHNRGHFEIHTKNHSKSHDAKAEVCEVCHKRFSTKITLKFHARTHIMDKPFSCDICKKCFKNKARIRAHMRSHIDVKPFVCVVCDKRFKRRGALNSHRNQHTGARPYKCEICEQTFTNSPNCNKHMIRKHGVSFYKSKITSIGKIEIDKKSGEVKDLAIDENAKEWLSKITAQSKAGRRTKTQK